MKIGRIRKEKAKQIQLIWKKCYYRTVHILCQSKTFRYNQNFSLTSDLISKTQGKLQFFVRNTPPHFVQMTPKLSFPFNAPVLSRKDCTECFPPSFLVYVGISLVLLKFRCPNFSELPLSEKNNQIPQPPIPPCFSWHNMWTIH